jgi:hypothetical protein
MKHIVKLFIVFILITSCSSKDTNQGDLPEESIVDTVKVEKAPEQEMKELQKKKDVVVNVDFKENKAKIEKKYGEQWDFCKCVVLNDSIDKAVKAGNVDDKLMERFDEVDKRCKSFLVMDNSRTPEERMLHDKKIAKCLREAGVK